MKTERRILGCCGGFERLHLWVFFAGVTPPLDDGLAMCEAFLLDSPVA